jgi:acyl-[acyl-carrier-protein]-phospholipid O-acyltransferase/long-chain-fatty-acid--[acyl-carrier-protein] ligase
LPAWAEALALPVARLLYRVRALGAERVPRSGGAVLVANHVSYVDAAVLQLACPRKLRFMAYRGPGTHPLHEWIFRLAGVIPLSPDRPSEWLRKAVRALRAGEVVCVFPEGGISRTGQLMAIRKGFELMARRAGVPVVPAALDGLWGSVFSFSGNRYLWKSPRLKRTPVCVAFGEPIAPSAADSHAARAAILSLWADALAERPVLRRNVGREAVRTLARRPWRHAVVDRSAGRRVVTAAQLIAACAVLASRVRSMPGRRIGIVLPPGAGAVMANLAVVCAGRVPVNLNFTAGRAAAEASLSAAGVETVLTADAMRARLEGFPWPARTLDIRAEIEAAGGRRAMAPWVIAAWLLPNQWVAGLLRIPPGGDRDEAALLFTSGSAGSPKGVVLSHRNLLANFVQISDTAVLPETSTLLGCLPVFHSFGFTVTLWYPLLHGCGLVTTPNPLDTRAVVDAVREEKVTVMLGAPSFIRPMLKKAAARDLASLELVVTGAERLPEDLRVKFLEAFHIPILQGYGLTETSPASNLNQPHPPVTTETADEQEGNRAGTVGRLLPGLAARLMLPDGSGDAPAGDAGILLLRGENVFSGYLGEPPGQSLRGGWLVTWDLARIDADGFVTIEGRLARFSKIGGEMVPHGTIEQRIAEAYGLDPGEAPAVAVTAVPDEAKGEALVLLSTLDITAAGLRERLAAAGLPNLWIPRRIVRVGAIPLLGTGKMDLAQCRRLAAGG